MSVMYYLKSSAVGYDPKRFTSFPTFTIMSNTPEVVARYEDQDMSLEAVNLLGSILAGVGYGASVLLFFLTTYGLSPAETYVGMSFVLFAMSFGAFWKRDPKMRPFKFIAWALWLVVVATICLAFQIQSTVTALVTNRDYPGGPNEFIKNNPGNWVNVMVNTL